jgi:hypothetical protein
LAFVEFAIVPLLRKFAKLVFGLVEPTPVAGCEMPTSFVRLIQIGVDAIDQPVHFARRIVPRREFERVRPCSQALK